MQADLLSASTGLRTLCFRLLWLEDTPSTFAWVHALLSQAASQIIEEIRFIFEYRVPSSQLQSFGLEQIDYTLSLPCFSRLRSVVFCLSGNLDYVAMARMVTTQAHRLADRGLLVFYKGDETVPLEL